MTFQKKRALHIGGASWLLLGAMHVGALDGSSTSQGRTWTAFVDATIVDDNGGLVADATVNGSWSGGASGSDSCLTNASGICHVQVSGIAKRNGSTTFTVDTVGGGLTYVAGDNVVSAVTVLKP